MWSNKECNWKKQYCLIFCIYRTNQKNSKVGNIWSRFWTAALIIDKLQYSNPLRSPIFDRNSFNLHRVLQYNNWTENRVKTECFSTPDRQKLILKIVKLAKLAIFYLNLVLNLVLILYDHSKRANAIQTSACIKFY